MLPYLTRYLDEKDQLLGVQANFLSFTLFLCKSKLQREERNKNIERGERNENLSGDGDQINNG